MQLTGDFGAIRLGRWTPGSYYATADYVSMHNHDTGTSEDKLYSGAGFTQTNKVGYFTPNISGFNGEFTLHAGEGVDTRGYDVALNYDQGPVHLGAGLQQARQRQAVRDPRPVMNWAPSPSAATRSAKSRAPRWLPVARTAVGSAAPP